MQDIDYKSLPSIRDIVTNSLHLHTAGIIKRRMDGATLSDVATEVGLTRSETRSIEKKGLEKLYSDDILVREDEYKYVYETYSFEGDFYLSLINGNQVLYYLKSRYEAGFGSIEQALNDSLITDKIKNELKAFYKIDVETVSSPASEDTVQPDSAFSDKADYCSNTIPSIPSMVSEGVSYYSASESQNNYVVPQYVRDAISDLWNAFQACGITESNKILEQASLFFFLKYLDDAELKNTATALSNGLPIKNLYFDNDHQNCRWSYFHNLDSTELIRCFTSEIMPFIKKDLRVDTGLTYSKLAQNVQLAITDSSLLTKIISTIDSITSGSHTNLYAIFELFVSMSGTSDSLINLGYRAMDFKIDDSICNAFPDISFSSSSIASFAQSEHTEEFDLVWNKMYFKNEMFHEYSTNPTILLINALRLLLQEVSTPDIQNLDILLQDFDQKFTKVIARIPAKPVVNQSYIRPSIKTMITANVPSLLYMYGCHEVLKDDGIGVLNVPHKSLTENSVSHRRLREFYIKDNTVLGIINLPAYNSDLFIYKKCVPHSFHSTLFAQIGELSSDIIDTVTGLMHSVDIDKSEYQDRSQPIFYIPDLEIEEHDYCLGYEEYSTREADSGISFEEVEKLDDVMRRIYNTQSDIDKSLSSIKKLLENL